MNTAMDLLKNRPVAVVGLGQIGMSWCAYFLARGLTVRGWDPDAQAAARTQAYIAAAWPSLQRMDLAPAHAAPQLTVCSSLEQAVSGCGFVQENGPETQALKRDVLAQIDAHAPEDAIIASSTSAIPMSALQGACRLPARCLTAHPFNPPHLVPLVELVGGAQTDAGAIEWARQFYLAIGREPVVLKREAYGHIANRLQYVLFNEAARLVLDGVASVADVDRAIAWGPGLRWPSIGPFMTFHLAGGEAGMAGAFAKFAARDAASTDRATRIKLHPEQQAQLHDGAVQAQAGLTLAQLEAQRDALLEHIVRAKKAMDGQS